MTDTERAPDPIDERSRRHARFDARFRSPAAIYGLIVSAADDQR